MKKISLLILFLSIILLTGCNFLGEEEETTVNVDVSNYIGISTVEDLKSMDINKSYELENDIDLNFEEWTPIGTYQRPFRGNFRGNDYTISNLKITQNYDGYNGLFGNLDGNVENLNIVNFDINFTTDFLANVGGLAGFSSGKITNVFVSGNIDIDSSNSNLYLGLLVGNAQTKLDDLVIAKEFKPNILSDNNASGTIIVSAEDIIYIGGLVGKAYNVKLNNNIINDLAVTVTKADSSSFIGGLIGHNFLYDVQTIEASLSVNKNLVYQNIVKAEFVINNKEDLSLGGLIGYNQNVILKTNFVTTDIEKVAEDRFDGVLASYIGLLVGENWVADIDKNLTINTNIIANFEANNISTISGKLFESEILNSFYYLSEDDLGFDIQGESVIYADLLTDQFYSDNFSDIDNEFISLIKSILLDE